jgi:hypothetical protein
MMRGEALCARWDEDPRPSRIVERTEPPSGKAQVSYKAAIAQVIIVVVDEDVEDEAFKQLAIVLAYHAWVAVPANRLCQVPIRPVR